MPQASVAITGGSSASALWIAKAFHEKGWKVHSLCSKAESNYDGFKATRIHFLKRVSQVHFALKAEDENLLHWIEKNKPTIWVHHHHHMINYRSSDYDLEMATLVGVMPIPNIIDILKRQKCKGIIATGSYFEPGEGGTKSNLNSPYGLSKAQAAMALLTSARLAEIKIAKVIVPDLMGPLENEDRFLPQVIKCAIAGREFHLKAPEQIADHLSFEDLGSVYTEVADNLIKQIEGIYRPSGLVASQESWLREIDDKLLSKMNLKIKIRLEDSLTRNDRSNPALERRKIDWDRFWINYLYFTATSEPWRIN